MATITKIPDPIVSAYDEVTVEEYSNTGLYNWANSKINNNDYTDRNLLNFSAIDIIGIAPEFSEQDNRIKLIICDLSTSNSYAGNGTVTNSSIPTKPDTKYTALVEAVTVQDANNIRVNSGTLTLPITWQEGSMPNNETKQSVMQFNLSSNESYKRIDFHIGSASDNQKNRLEWTADIRNIIGIPKGFTFDRNGWRVPLRTLSSLFPITYEVLFTTGPATQDTQYILVHRPSESGSSIPTFLISLYDSLLTVRIGNKNNLIQNILPNTLYHITACADPSSFEIRINGVVSSTGTITSAPTAYINAIDIGFWNGWYFRGAIHFVRVYSKSINNNSLWNDGDPFNKYFNIADYTENYSGYNLSLESLPHNLFRNTIDPQPLILLGASGEPSISYVDFNTGESPAVLYQTPLSLQIKNRLLKFFEAGSVIYQKSPEEIVANYDPDDPDNNVIMPIEVEVLNGISTSEGVLKSIAIDRESDPENKVEADLSYILRRAFRMKPLDGTVERWYTDFNLVGYYTLPQADGSIKAFTRMIKQVGYPYNISELDRPTILMRTPPIRYDGFPLDIALLNPTWSGSIYFEWLTDKNSQASLHLTYPVMVINTGVVGTEDSESNIVRFWIGTADDKRQHDIVWGCMPEDPFYIRWINDLGGYDYKMFAWRKVYNEEITDITNIQKAPINPFNTQETIYAEGNVYVTTGDEGLERSEYDTLKMIGRSPLIQWWDTDLSKWHTIVIQKESKTSWDTESGLGSVEFAFQMPRLKLQF